MHSEYPGRINAADGLYDIYPGGVCNDYIPWWGIKTREKMQKNITKIYRKFYDFIGYIDVKCDLWHGKTKERTAETSRYARFMGMYAGGRK